MARRSAEPEQSRPADHSLSWIDLAALVALVAAGATAPALAGTLSIGWDEVDDPAVVGYRVFSGATPGEYSQSVDVDLAETTLAGFADCETHYVAVKARAADGGVSDTFSNEIAGWPTPTVTTVVPAALPAASTLELIVHGTNFKPGATVSFGDPAIQVLGSTVVDCRSVLVEVRVAETAAVGATSSVELINPDHVYGCAFGAVTIAPDESEPSGDDAGVDPDEAPGDLQAGLVAHWTMNADSVQAGILLDRSGHGHHGQIIGAVLDEGRSGESLRFASQSDQRVIVPDSDALDLAGSYSISAWVRADSYGEGQHGEIVSKFNAGRVEGWSLGLTNESARASQRVFGLTSQSVSYGQPETTRLHEWQHVAVTYAARSLTYWVDGTAVRTATVMHDPRPGLRHVTIGNDKQRSSDFHGRIDELRLYDRALGAHEIAALAGQDASDVCPDLDGDGHADAACGGDDCDDGAAAVHPGAAEVCGDWIDGDCDGSDVACPCADLDADGVTAAACGGADCDDLDPAVRPGAPETCGDGVDQNCDGADEACPTCADADGDGHPDAACGGTDCDDSDSAVHPGASESCDGVDQDCDGEIDELACETTDDSAPDESDPEDAGLPPLVAYWSMDLNTIEGEILRDLSDAGHHGTIIGATSEPGRFGEALRFRSGLDQYVVVPDADDLDLTGDAFTVSAWIWAETFGEQQTGTLLSNFNASRVEGWGLALQNGGHQGLRLFGTSYQGQLQSDDSVVALRRWQHVAAVHAGGRVTFWVDGVWAGSERALHAPNAGMRNLYLGNEKDRSTDFDGLIDEVRIHDGALSDDAIRALAAGETFGGTTSSPPSSGPSG